MEKLDSRALNYTTVALFNNGTLYIIMEAQQEFEGDLGSVTPAKSIWLNTSHAKELRDFLNEKYPSEELKRLNGIEQALQDFCQPNAKAQDVFDWLESTTGYRGHREGAERE